MRLVGLALGFLNWLGEKKRTVQGPSQSHSSGDVAFEVRDHTSALNNLAAARWNVAGHHQSNSDYPVEVGQGRRAIKVDDGHWSAGNWNEVTTPNIQQPFANMSDYGCGILSHDGSYKLFKWNAASGCMAPFELSNPKQS